MAGASDPCRSPSGDALPAPTQGEVLLGCCWNSRFKKTVWKGAGNHESHNLIGAAGLA